MPVRIAAPSGIGGLVDTILNPGYSTAVGLLLWGAGEPRRRRAARTSRRPRRAVSAGSATPSGASSRRHPGAHPSGPESERGTRRT